MATVPKTPVSVVLYLDRTPISLEAIAQKAPGEISTETLVTNNARIDELGIVHCWGSDPQECKKLILQILASINAAIGKVTIIACGEEDDSHGKVSIFVRNLKNVTDVLAREVEVVVRDLGLHSEKTHEISHIVANEIMCDVAIQHSVNTGSLLLRSLTQFSGWLVINERLKKEMVRRYTKSVEQYAAVIKGKSPLLKRFEEVMLEKKGDLAIAIISGLVVEVCIRLIIYLAFSAHREVGTNPITILKLPAPVMAKVQSEKVFSASEIAKETGTDEIWAVLLLNTLADLELVRMVSPIARTYVGTGLKSVPRVVGATECPEEEKAVTSAEFRAILEVPLKEEGQFDWWPSRPESTMKDIYLTVFPGMEE
jgi:hypothetical protein